MMEEKLRAAMLADSALEVLVDDRIDWGLRASALPAIRLQLVSKVPFYTHAGVDQLVPHLVQIDCFGKNYGDAKHVARAVQVVLVGLGRPAFDACFVENERDDADQDAAGNPVHRTSLDVRIWFHNP